MNFADIIALAWRNLRQSKLRTALTVIGVIVGVAAIITMVSFGIGLQQNIIGQAFARLDAFTAITVLGADADDLLALSEGRTAFDEEEPEGPPEKTEDAASPTPAGPAPTPEIRRPRRALDDAAIAEIQKLDGVRFAAPIVRFECYVRFNDRTRSQSIIGAVPDGDPRLKNLLAGRSFSSEDASEIVVNENFLGSFSAEALR
ncbi:MAG: ABC transporter permease, partial [Blastocatellia bacterium]